MAKKLTNDQTITTILSYLGILWIIPLLIVKKRDDFINFHLSQGINLFILEIIVFVILGVLQLVPIIGLFFTVLYYIAWVCFIIAIIVAIVRGLQGEKWKIPVVKKTKFVTLK